MYGLKVVTVINEFGKRNFTAFTEYNNQKEIPVQLFLLRLIKI